MLRRWITRLLVLASVLAAAEPALAAAQQLSSGAWRSDVCYGGGAPDTVAHEHDGCCPAPGSVGPTVAPWGMVAIPGRDASPIGRATPAHANPRYTHGVSRAPPRGS